MSTRQPLAPSPPRPPKEAGLGLRRRWMLVTDLVIIAAIVVFLLCYFEPCLLFSKTITTGGDTGSHYFTAEYLRNYLLPRGKISGWCQGNLGGFPVLQNYFPLPFLLMAFLSWVIPLEIAFKIVTVLGTFLLPVCAYAFFRLLRHPFPVPAMGAVFTLPFLFMEGNSMWGGNIPSTLAGTFCYSLGFSLTILWLGLVYRAVTEGKGRMICAIVLAMVGMCHGYTLLFAVFVSVFFLFAGKEIGRNLKTLLHIHILAFFLMAFWLIPLIFFLPYTTRFSILWIFFDLKQIGREIFPVILYPFMGLAVVGAIRALVKKARPPCAMVRRPWAYVWFSALCGAALYFIGYRIGVVDIRFLPFLQFFLVAAGAMAFSWVASRPKAAVLSALMALVLTFLWVDERETFIRNWIRSNYSGFESRLLWEPFMSVNRFLKGTPNDPRVVYEHSMIHQGAGTVRAFESLPLFSGRSTLEGVYIQGSLSVPFIFYLQSEISQKASTPIPDYSYSRFNLRRGIEHLKLFNVRELIAAESETKAALHSSAEFRLQHKAGPYEVYALKTGAGGYVTPVENRPVLITEGDFRRLFYKWFRLGDLDVPLVFTDRVEEKELQRFYRGEAGTLDIRNLPVEPLRGAGVVKEIVREEEIVIEGAAPGKPLLIKVSYHPNWKVEGADKIYLASPAFMLIYPESSEVRLYYGRTWPDFAGAAMTLLAILYILLLSVTDLSRLETRISIWFDRWCLNGTLIFIGAACLAAGFYLVRLSPEFPVLSYNKGIASFTQEDFSTARRYFKEVLERFPQTLIVDQAAYHLAMCSFREKKWEDTIRELMWLLREYPETGRAGEVFYHVGICYLNLGRISEAREWFSRTVDTFPDEVWGRFAGDRLKELQTR
jgi:hypothetical protein